MSRLRRFVLVLLLFLALVVVISMFLPSSFQLERSILIDADKEQIFKQVNDFKNWKNWAPWALKDETIFDKNDAFSIPSYGKGATFNWDSDNGDIGKGVIEIIESTSNSYIKNKVIFGFTESIDEWNFNDFDNEVEVIWSMNVDFGFNPIAKFFGLFMEDQIAPDYELGLKRLKTFSENLPKIKKVIVEKKKMDKDLWFLSIRDTVNQGEMNNIHGRIYETINNYMDEKNIVSNSSPIVIYHLFTKEIIDIEAGIPVSDSILVEDSKIKLNKITATNVVTAIHYGAYERLPETYFGINEWMRKNKVIVTGPPWELYVTDPAEEPNPEKWETAIYFPIE